MTIMNCSFSYQKRVLLLIIRRKQISFFYSIFRSFFFAIITISITEDLTITLAELHVLQLRGCFSQVVYLNLSMLHFFIAVHIDKSFPTATLFHNFQTIFQKFDTKVATEIDLNMFNLESILSSLALETGTVNYNLILNSVLLQPLLLGAVKILYYVTK